MDATDPVVELARAMRDGLIAAGLTRKELDGSVYFAQAEACAYTQPAIVLLHGTNDHAGTWTRIAPMLVDRYRLIIPDLAGHGESEPKDGPIPFHLVLDQLHDILNREHAQGITLVGNSFGGWIAILYALAHPERVQRLVLESGGGLARPLGVPLIATDRETAKTILQAVHGPNYVPAEWAIDALLARATNSPLLRIAGAMENFVDSRLPQLKKPTILIWGADDKVVPLSYGEALKRAIDGAKLRVIDGAAHIPHLQQPERFVECLTATS